MPDDVCFLSATEMARRIRAGELSPVAVVEACLERIEERNDAVNAFVTRLDDSARSEARRAEKQLAHAEDLGPLHGVPVAIKDLFDYVAGVRNTFGCRALESFVPPESVLYVERLRAAGAILIGKTNTPEFGHKGITDNLIFGPTSTPFDLTRNSGGSSGGSAAAVADGMVPLAQGSDAGGSIRIPAAHCGVVGFKPSVGRVAAAYRPDGFLHTPCLHAGPITRTVEDAALMASVMCGPDESDPLSLPDDGIDWLAALEQDVSGLRIAFSPDLGGFPVDPGVSAVIEDAVASFAGAGLVTEPLELDLGASHEHLTDLWLQQMAVLYAGTVENLSAAGIDLLGETRGDLCPEFVSLVERGRRLSAVEAKQGDVLRTRVFDALQSVFTDHDVIVSPTVGVPPVPNASDGSTLGPSRVNGCDVERTIGWCLTHPINFSGHPAISVPAGLTSAGLPVGLQIVGRRFDDATVLAVAATLERVRPWLQDLPAWRSRS
ncbi:MAG: amidase [Planctomycetota bacterium]|nr:amidase [Planctomycetota bacterium]